VGYNGRLKILNFNVFSRFAILHRRKKEYYIDKRNVKVIFKFDSWRMKT